MSSTTINHTKFKMFIPYIFSIQVPAFESSDGKCLTDSNAIAYYVANDQLRGKTDFEKAQILQWLGFADSEILPASCAWVFPILGILQYQKSNVDRAKEDLKHAMKALNAHLLTRTYLVGERISLADIALACTLLQLYTNAFDPEFRKSFQNVNRWFTTLVNQPNFKKVVGDVKLCAKAAEIDPKKFQHGQGQFFEYSIIYMFLFLFTFLLLIFEE